MDDSPAIGIDLGTTNSVVATVQNGQSMVIKNRSGTNLTPSVVAIAATGKRLVGAIAKRQAVTNAENTAYAVKRLIGRKFSSREVKDSARLLSYTLVEGDHDDVRVRLAGRDFAVQELSAMILGELKADAEAYFGCTVTRAVITVPAYFNDGQRQATRDAGLIAGLEVLRIINEPTAAALAYGFGRHVEGRIAIFDLGGGTFDISVMDIAGGVFQVLASGGDTALGGEDFDARLIEHLLEGFQTQHGVDLRVDKMAMQRVKEAAERAKCELSSVKETPIHLPFLYSAKEKGVALHLQTTLARTTLEALTTDLIDRCLVTCGETLEDAGVKPSELVEVILVGGMSRMPRVAEAVKKFFGREPSKGVHPDEVVAQGAAIQAAALVGEAPAPSPGPALSSEETNYAITPAPAAAPTASPLKENIVLLDVTPHSLGVAIAGGYAKMLIVKNSTVPTSATHLFHTSKDFQTTVKVMVLQGESAISVENEVLGEFMLTGLRAAARGEVEVEITFEISADGIVSVSARDTHTNQRQSITVTASGGLTQAELAKILDEQRDYLMEATADEEVLKKRDEVGKLIREVEELTPRIKTLVASSSFGADVLVKAEKNLGRAREAVAGSNLAILTTALDELTRTVQVFKGVIQRLGGGS